MTAIFLPSTRYCGYSEHCTCYNCYVHGVGGPCSNCVLETHIQMKLVDWKEYRAFENNLPSSYHKYINNPKNQYEHVKLSQPPNGTWNELMLKIKYQSTTDEEENKKTDKLKRKETLERSEKMKIKKILNSHWAVKAALDRRSRPGKSKSRLFVKADWNL